MLKIEEFLNERGYKGLDYEKDVKKFVRGAAKGRPTQVATAKGGGSFSAHDTDMVVRVKKKDYPIEIKANQRAQMGGISISYNYDTDTLTIPKSKNLDLDDETVEMILESVQQKKKDIHNVIGWFKKNDPSFKYNKTRGFPLRVSTEAWDKAIKEGVVKSLNQSIKNTAKFITSYYKTKGVNYMQIGGAGLFYLDSNPLKLDVPRLKGEINLEFRAGKSGVKYNKTQDYEYSTVVLRLQGRLLFNGMSDLTLDSKEGAKDFMDAVEK